MIWILFFFQKNSDWILNLLGDKSKVSYSDDTGYLHVPDVVVNLPGSDGRFCKAGFTLAVNKTGFESLKGNNYRHFLKASITELISSYRYEKLLSFEGKMQLKMHIRANLNKKLASNLVKDVYYSEIVFQ